jgi:GNAT superfamily N-acetyltransferase
MGNDVCRISWERETEAGAESVFITNLFVDPGERRKGIGRRLLKEAIRNISIESPGIPIKLAVERGDNAEILVAFYASESFEIEPSDAPRIIMVWAGKEKNMDPATLLEPEKVVHP